MAHSRRVAEDCDEKTGYEPIDPKTERLSDQCLDRVGGFDSSQTLIEALVFVRELLVIDAKQIENRRLKIANVNGISWRNMGCVPNRETSGSGKKNTTAARRPYVKPTTTKILSAKYDQYRIRFPIFFSIFY